MRTEGRRGRTREDEGGRGRTREDARAIALESALAFLLLTLLYLATRQEHYWGDAKFILQWVENGRWDYYHLAYLPAAQSLHGTLGRAFSLSAEDSLRLLSLACGALSGAVLLAAMRVAGGSRWTSAAVTALYASAPSVWFYATAIEVHALQMLLCACVCLWGACAVRAGTFGRDPLPVVLGVAAVVAGHLSGVTWIPALAFVLWFGARGAGAARWTAALVSGLAFTGLWWWVDRASERGAYHLDLGLKALLHRPRLELGWREWLVPGGALWFLSLPAAVSAGWLRERSRSLSSATRLALRATLLLLATSVPMAFLIEIQERGAYFVGLLPVACLWLALAAEELPRWRLVLFAAVPLQFALGHAALEEFEGRTLPPEMAWVELLVEEGGERVILLTSVATLAQPVQEYTPVTPVVVTTGMGLDLAQAEVRARLKQLAASKRAEGYRIALTSELLAHEPEATFVRELEAAFGVARTGRDAHYALLPGADE